MNSLFQIIPTESLKVAGDKFNEEQRKEILSGNISVRWSQACCGYRIRVGRSPVLGLESFMTEEAAVEWLKETHNIDLK